MEKADYVFQLAKKEAVLKAGFFGVVSIRWFRTVVLIRKTPQRYSLKIVPMGNAFRIDSPK